MEVSLALRTVLLLPRLDRSSKQAGRRKCQTVREEGLIGRRELGVIRAEEVPLEEVPDVQRRCQTFQEK
jgi:hypothetical protein